MTELPKIEDFSVTAYTDEGALALLCPELCGWVIPLEDPAPVHELLAKARAHVDDVHDRCDAGGNFGEVGNLQPYRCDRKRHNDLRHNWVQEF